MYSETKKAVKKAFEIGQIIFGLGKTKYTELLNITNKISAPTIRELEQYDCPMEEAIVIELKKRYTNAAKSVGLTEKEGMAMLEYAVFIQELDDG